MLYEPTTLASATSLLETSLREGYGIDPAPLFKEAGLSPKPPESPELRYPTEKIRRLWALSREATGDEEIGLKTGWYAKPRHFYAFGYSWMASSTLHGAMSRLTRYYKLMSTASVEVSLIETANSYALRTIFPDRAKAPPDEGIDCGLTATLALCDIVAEKKIRPMRVELTSRAPLHPDVYRRALDAIVVPNCEVRALHFDKDLLREALPHAAPEIAKATDKIAENYIETLDPHKIASQVTRLLIDLLPSGKADQELVSNRLNRSPSTLQRQLQNEGLSYREVLETTQRSLAETYLREKKHSHAQIAYLLGFSEQSNFSRAFKRWTSVTPRQFQDAVDERSSCAD
jgi:AraC-like DNA-binding protein